MSADLTEKKRDQRPYELFMKYSHSLILNTILNVVNELGDPYEAKPGVGGMKAYPPKAMAAVCLFMEAVDETRRGMSSYLRFHQDTAGQMGLCRIPSKSTISRAYGLIPEGYLAGANALITARIEAGSRAGDSTGYSNNCYRRWLDERTNKIQTRMGWNKLHAVIDIRTRVIIDYIVTPGNVANVTAMRIMLGRLAAGDGDFCLDAAYLAREICNQIVELNMTPYIQPKSNTVHNAKGSWSWRFMVDLYNDNPGEFYSRYHQRSIVEAVFAAIKTMYNYRLRTRKPENQRREIGMHVVCYNIGLVIRSRIKDGMLTSDMLKRAAAC